MPVAEMSRSVGILRSLYPNVQTLEEFSNSIVFREGHKAHLVEPPETTRFLSFVRGVYVCTDKTLQYVPSRNQICTLPELLAFILNSFKRKKKRNVLAHGYGYPLAQEERDADQFKFQGDVTQSAAYIHGSDLWKKVSQRLGTDVTRYMLECCSVFVTVPPTCLFQVCGTPVYERVSMTTGSGFNLQSRSRRNATGNIVTLTIPWNRRERYLKYTKSSRRRWGSADSSGEIRQKKRERDMEENQRELPGKRRRIEQEGVMQSLGTVEGSNQGRCGTGDQPKSVDLAVCPRPVEDVARTKHPVKLHTLPSEAGASWRTGLFPPLPPAQCFIRTLGMLYGGRGMRSFLLNRKRKGEWDEQRRLQGRDLVRIMFFEGVVYLKGVERKPKKLPKRFFNMVPLFSQLLRRHRSCAYTRILQKLCPGVVKGVGEGQGEMAALLPQHSAPHRVYLFIKECLATVVPWELWGSDHNRLNFLFRVREFLRMGKHERLSLAELLWKMKVNDCDWIKLSKTGRCPPSELAYRTRVLGQFLAWLLDGYVLGLVRACFYVTESMGHKNALRFYRQEVWARLQELAFRTHQCKGQMEELTPAQVVSLPRTTVTSRLRFIPKTEGMRPITRVLGADPKTRRFQASVRDLLDVLRVCVRTTPALLGSTVWGMTDIHRVLGSLAPAQKNKPQSLYFVKVDVSGAYDSLPHSKLLEVIRQVLSPVQEETFSVRRYAKVWANFHEGLKKTFVRKADFLEDTVAFTNMKAFVMSLQTKGKVHNAILVEQHFSLDLQGKDVLEFFTQMLTGSVVQFGKKMFRQWQGIPQGSVVSSLLCCLCYAHMENFLFKNLTEKGGHLMRLVDDFLLITPDLNQAQTFLKTLLAGVPQYGCVVNPQKVAINFPMSEDQGVCPETRVLPAHCLFPWCGLLLDTRTLDVYCDYSSYAGLSLRYSLTVGPALSAGKQMRRKLMGILRLKCHALFLDLKTNSLEAVYKNLYKLVLLHACRFHVCAQSLPFGQKVSQNPVYFLHLIWNMAEYTNQLIRLCNRGVTLGSKAQTGCLQYEAVELIYCLSFSLVLSRYRPLYRDLLTALHSRKKRLERNLGDLRLLRVRQAATPKTPPDFMAICF
ncbi:telomerase reverse transcriptase [Osmerus mordax]|uniref:telomerase reverse transcriptase n=1 Tax=Osmerus mordax TaxID=8014 RepID=UPI003510CD9C